MKWRLFVLHALIVKHALQQYGNSTERTAPYVCFQVLLS